MSAVVVINADYTPHDVVSVKHAMKMLYRQVAVVEEEDAGQTFGPYPLPRVVRLIKFVYMKWRGAHRAGVPRYSRNNILKRDKYTCAYCGRYGDTIDHINPVSKGGETSWMNCVTACYDCNSLKRDRTPSQAGMSLKFEPRIPSFADLI
ncbi:MAG: HNH endonuclease [Spirochaetes bacterium]|nr:MAG: HNH endonuclease [Spirochaetota bacterium]